MAVDKRLGRHTPSNTKAEMPGVNLNPGPFEAIVKNVIDSTRSGRLQVWIPDMGAGDQNDAHNWITVSYASPFAGMTYQPSENPPKENLYSQAQNTYGFFAVPPDIGNMVLVTFVNGDPQRGYWFACVVNKLDHNMIPGLAGGDQTKFDSNAIESAELKKALTNDSNWPMTEINEADGKNVEGNFLSKKRAPHEWQTKRYIKQGLDKDRIRGAVSSSSQRNSPSAVFGISTPGRPLSKDPADDDAIRSKIEDGSITPTDVEFTVRKGGHSFVMDDGDFYGGSQLVRLRTAYGHQILMDDSNKTLYIINSEGSCWVELAGSGQMHVFSSGGLNLRSQGDINMHSDKDIKIYAANGLKMVGGQTVDINTNILSTVTNDRTVMYGGKIELGASGAVNVSAGGSTSWNSSGAFNVTGDKILLNSGAGPTVGKPNTIPIFTLDETAYNSGTGTWTINPNALASIVNIAPTHEPYTRFSGVSQKDITAGQAANAGGATTGKTAINDAPAPETGPTPTDCVPSNVVKDSNGNPVKSGSGGYVTSGEEKLDPGPASGYRQNLPKSKLAPKSYMSREETPNPPGGIGPLSQLHVKALCVAMGYCESAFNYKAINQLNYVGKYQFGAAALTDLGYIKLDFYKQYKNSAVKQAGAWTGEDGIKSLEDFFNAPAIQEKAFFKLLNANYKRMVSNGAIKEADNLCTIAGMMCVAQLLGPNTGTEKAPGAKGWRSSAAGQDANGVTGGLYFAVGKYAIDVLAAPTNV
jgi:hypothetical protein